MFTQPKFNIGATQDGYYICLYLRASVWKRWNVDFFFWSVRKLTPRRCASDLSLLKSEAPRATLSPFTPRENEISPFIY